MVRWRLCIPAIPFLPICIDFDLVVRTGMFSTVDRHMSLDHSEAGSTAVYEHHEDGIVSIAAGHIPNVKANGIRRCQKKKKAIGAFIWYDGKHVSNDLSSLINRSWTGGSPLSLAQFVSLVSAKGLLLAKGMSNTSHLSLVVTMSDLTEILFSDPESIVIASNGHHHTM